MASDIEPQFGKWRQRLWPIHRFELKKFIPLLLLKFLISFNYVLLYNTKDTLVVTGEHSGAEVISILKGWFVLPCAFLVLLVYTKLSNRFSMQKMVYTFLTPFLLFFFVFGFILFPNKEFFTPYLLCDKLFSYVGQGHSHWIAPIYNWMNSLYYVVAELWGQVVIMLLFWTYANNITRMKEAKRYYTLFTAAGDFGPMLGGALVAWIASMQSQGDFVTTVQHVSTLAIIVGLLVMGVFWWMGRYVMTDPRLVPEEEREEKKKKPKLSLGKSFKYILSSKYLLCLAAMVIGYGLAMNLVEIAFKAHLKQLYPVANDYQNFGGKLMFYTGLIPFLVAFFAGGNILRVFGWTKTAMLTPIVVGGCGVLFLLVSMSIGRLEGIATLLGVTPLVIVVGIGAFQSVMGKTMKYSLFDPTKEMAFIPLDPEAKIKGKAAIDVVGSRLGKSGSSWLQAGLLDTIAGGSILSVTWFLAPVVAIVVFGWLMAIKTISPEFTKVAEESHG